MQEFLKSLAPVMITALVSIMVVLITQYKAKRLSFFQVFFSKKVEIYALFWEAVSVYEAEQTKENYARLETELHRVCLVAPKDVYMLALDISNALRNRQRLSGQIGDMVTAMRQDLDRCMKMKFDFLFSDELD